MTKAEILTALIAANDHGKLAGNTERDAYEHLRQSLLAYVNSPDNDR